MTTPAQLLRANQGDLLAGSPRDPQTGMVDTSRYMQPPGNTGSGRGRGRGRGRGVRGAAAPMAAPVQATDPYSIERQRIQEDLSRQLGLLGQNEAWKVRDIDTQMQWLRDQLNKQIGQMQTELPEQQGRLGSNFAARGSYNSGAREEAQKGLLEQMNQSIEAMRTEQAHRDQLAAWEKEQLLTEDQQKRDELNLKVQRAMQDLKMQQDADAAAALSGGGRRGGRGGGGSSAIDPDKYRSEATAYGRARVNQYQSQGSSLADAQARAMQDMRTRYPHLDETWLYSIWQEPKATKAFGTYDISAARGQAISPAKQATLKQKPAYKTALSTIRDFLSKTAGRGTAAQLAKLSPATAAQMKSNPQLFSVAWLEATYGG